MVLPASGDSCCMFVVIVIVVVGTDRNWNFSAVLSLIDLKFDGDLELVSQISI
jgi:hypothetical protein